MKIVIPMAGSGQRFISAGHHDPKPLIEVSGRPMIEHVIKKFSMQDEFVFICHRDHLERTRLAEILGKLVPRCQIVPIEPHKKGPVVSILEAKELIADQGPVIVNYCDFNWSWDYQDFKERMLAGDQLGAVVCYRGFHPHLLGKGLYAGCRGNERSELVEIKEKYSFSSNKMDSYHSSGTYYFASGALLKSSLKYVLDKDINIQGEYYVSSAYGHLLQKGKVVIYEIPFFCQWGTPEDLAEYIFWAEYFQEQALCRS